MLATQSLGKSSWQKPTLRDERQCGVSSIRQREDACVKGHDAYCAFRILEACGIQYSSHKPHVAVKPWKRGQAKSRCTANAKYRPDFKDLALKKNKTKHVKCVTNNFDIDYMLMWYF